MTEVLINTLILFSLTISSDNGLYHASISFGRETQLSVASFTLYDHNSEILYTKQELDVNTFFISNIGTVFALNDKHLYFYGDSGEEELLKDIHYSNNFGFSPDHFLFFASDKDGVFAYTMQGELIYALRPGRLFASTEQGHLVAIIAVDTLFLYEHGVQRFIQSLATPYARSISFSDDGESIIVDEPSGSEIFDTRTGARQEQK